MEKKKFIFDTNTIVVNALIAALYVAMNAISAPIAFGAIQFRIAEMLMLFVFFNKKYAFGVTLGCLLANLMSPFFLLDIVFGTLATLVASIGIMFCKHLWMAALCPVVANAFIVAGVLTSIGEPYWMSVLTVGLGELAVMTFSYIIFMLLKKNKGFFEGIHANQNVDFKC